MAKQTIGLGTVDNDGTGDSAKVAGDKINDNFTELYDADAALDGRVDTLEGTDVSLDGRLDLLEVGSVNNHFGYVSGRHYYVDRGYGANGSALASANRIYFYPFMVQRPVTISAVGARIVSGNAAGNMAFAVYAAHASTRLPTGNPLGNTGSQSTASAGRFTPALGANLALVPGVAYWAAINVSITGLVFTTSLPNAHLYLVGSATLNNLDHSSMSRYFNSTFPGTWPDMTSNATTENPDNANFSPIIQVA